MATDMWVGTWRPHRPRGPIAALYSSPGPKYGLPGATGFVHHDPSKYRAPAYSFGSRRFKFVDDCSPGPGYLVPANITMRGKDGTPAYSIYGRPRDLNTFRTPGPGTYSPERSGKSAYPSSPTYSLAARTKAFSNDQTPGPAAYMLPSVLGPRIVDRSSAPNYTMTGRSKIGSFHEDLQKNHDKRAGRFRSWDRARLVARCEEYVLPMAGRAKTQLEEDVEQYEESLSVLSRTAPVTAAAAESLRHRVGELMPPPEEDEPD
ncbi:ciliary microtubule associated protein 1A-like [Ascaphus truei]|uniref:ciliary microtubule associated protein 1A-like n=1 Tax=Ascaphus truei TaxID=8439 RepID=UPI003F5AC370